MKQFIRYLNTNRILLNKQDNIKQNIKLLSKYYSPEIIKSIQISENLVEPKQLLKLKLWGQEGKNDLKTENTQDYSKIDPEWNEPILYPNQGLGRTPYPKIPQVYSPDRSDLNIRFSNAPRKTGDNQTDKSGIKTTFQIAEGISQLTGFDERYLKNLYHRPLIMKRVSLKTRKGNIASFFVLSVVGDKNGMIGIGIGKSRDGIRTAASKAHWDAIKNLTYVKRYEDRTILGSIEYKFQATKLKLKPAPIGFGLRVNRNIFEMCQAVGIKDLRGKVFKSRNPMTVCKAFFEALKEQKSIDELAANRGKKIIELRKVYYTE
ncbi:unnamed protein product [Candida verbasci]|uniref:Small ribosomal subunit protein uS5m n=1 Tax=Candida verbasci TaxID=1227364 RepID=A0A9W4TTP4_9ASCO|nr:unnamed protein product [Candida verbasci]